jgi:hypothetical protein
MPSPSAARQGLRGLQRWVGEGLDLLFPNQCLGCGRAGIIWCQECDARLERIVDALWLARVARWCTRQRECAGSGLRSVALQQLRWPASPGHRP